MEARQEEEEEAKDVEDVEAEKEADEAEEEAVANQGTLTLELLHNHYVR